jgi:hypothetical protein
MAMHAKIRSGCRNQAGRGKWQRSGQPERLVDQKDWLELGHHLERLLSLVARVLR